MKISLHRKQPRLVQSELVSAPQNWIFYLAYVTNVDDNCKTLHSGFQQGEIVALCFRVTFVNHLNMFSEVIAVFSQLVENC